MIKIDTAIEAEEFTSKNQIMRILAKTSFESRKTMRSQKWFKEKYSTWHSSSIRKQDKIGSLMVLIEECNPISLEEWTDFYFTTFTSYTAFKELVEEASIVLGLNIEQSLIYLWVHIIDFAWEGFQAEKEALKVLNKQYPFIIFQKANEYEDKHYGIDFIAFDLWTGDKIGAIQVKGVSYFLGKFASKRMNGHKSGYTEFFRKTGVRINYLLKEDVSSGGRVTMFPVECYGDTVPVDYKVIIPSIIKSVKAHKVLEK